jgi:hypothetical protein
MLQPAVSSSSLATTKSSQDPAAIAARLIEQAEALERAILLARDGVERKGQRAELGRAARAARRVVRSLGSMVPARALKRQASVSVSP